MLISSNLTINLHRSRDYLIFGVAVNLFVLVLMYCAEIPFKYIFGSICLQAWPMLDICQTKLPHSNILKLAYYQKHWFLYHKNGQELEYEKVQIRLDTGLFMLISLSGINKRKNLIIFYDQICDDERRRLNIIEKIS
ncbi:MAG: hypothetical protein P1U74_01930 [Legionellaceae bacterium]|nr:hypothetical protein [Legionellaceae bacterium]